jgi:hypothetical protein
MWIAMPEWQSPADRPVDVTALWRSGVTPYCRFFGGASSFCLRDPAAGPPVGHPDKVSEFPALPTGKAVFLFLGLLPRNYRLDGGLWSITTLFTLLAWHVL